MTPMEIQYGKTRVIFFRLAKRGGDEVRIVDVTLAAGKGDLAAVSAQGLREIGRAHV